jgi:hypothetical protein
MNFDNGRRERERDCVWPAGHPPGWHQEEKKDTPDLEVACTE